MYFNELEKLMKKRNVHSLAQIARALDTTPQAVSNWKARNQVPYHVVNKVNNFFSNESSNQPVFKHNEIQKPKIEFDESTISLSDILLILAQQLKIILIAVFVSVFLNFTYVQFIKEYRYESSATILLPQQISNSLGGIAGLASQFGVNVPSESAADLSSPSLYPELITSRMFAEKILDKKIYVDKYGKYITLLAALTHGIEPNFQSKEMLITKATKKLNNDYIQFKQTPKSSFSTLRVYGEEPKFAQDLANIILVELDSLNRYFKSQHVKDKRLFIDERISSVKNELESSETNLKKFKEQNRQISSPALQLEQDRLNREVDVQKGIYLTLKQQLELAKIEEVQEASIVQVLDRPNLPLWPANRNIKMSIFLSLIIGIFFGIVLAFIRAYLNNNDIDERKKLRKTKSFFKKKGIESLRDSRITGTVMIMMLFASPLYLGYKSQEPMFFGRYSLTMLIINVLYLSIFIVSIILFFKKNK